MPDEADFAAFVHGRGPALLKTAAFLSGGRAEGEDLLQHALASAYAKYGRLRDPAALEAYVRVTLFRTATSWRRRAWRQRVSLQGEPSDVPARNEFDTVLERAALWPLLQQLSPRQRAVVVLRYYEDMSEEQIAAELGCSRGSVKRHGARAIDKLRQFLEQDEVSGEIDEVQHRG